MTINDPDYQALLTTSQRQAQELALLDKVRTNLARELDLSLLLKNVVQDVSSIFNYDLVSLYLLEDSTLVIQHCVGYDRILDRIPLNKGVMSKAIRSTTPIFVPDIRQEPDYLGAAEDVESEIAIPLLQRGRPVGVLNVETTSGRLLDESDLRVLIALSKDIEIALGRTLLHKEVELFARRMALLNDVSRAALKAPDLISLLQVLADRLGELFDADGAYITLWDDERQLPIPMAAFGEMRDTYRSLKIAEGSKTATGEVLEREQVLAIEDISRCDFISPHISDQLISRALLCLPLIANNRKLGAALIGFNTPREFAPEEFVLGDQASRQLALAIAKVQALEAEVKRTAELGRINLRLMALSRISSRVEAHYTVSGMLKTLGEELAVIGIFSSICFKRSEADDLAIRHICLGPGQLEKLENAIGAPIVGRVINPTNFPYYDEVFIRREPVYSPNWLSLFRVFQLQMSVEDGRTLFKSLGLDEDTHLFILPLMVNELEQGALCIWGKDLLLADLPAVTIFSGHVAVILEKISMHQKIQQMAITDELTEVYNRRGITEIGKREFDRSRRYGRPLAVLILDVDHFKIINDTFGHATGDQVLKLLAERMKKMVRDMDIVGRHGGEEFLALLPDCGMEEALGVAERLRVGVAAQSFHTKLGAAIMTVSIGVAVIDEQTRDLYGIIANADRAMYDAKNAGRNCVRTYIPE